MTMIEVLVAALVVAVGLVAVLGTFAAATRVTRTNKVRQDATSLARELIEDAQSVGYSQLTPSTIASALAPVVPGATVAGSGLAVTRAGSTFTANFTVCSLDDPSDGYGNHTSPPSSGGSWCPDVATNGTADSNPDDYKRLSVTITQPSQTFATVQQTDLIYNRPTHGPAVNCLSTNTNCPGVNQSLTSGSSLAFNVTTTSVASAIQWLVNGNPPDGSQLPTGAFDPYQPTSTSSTFTWNFPTADGTYTIAALGFDGNGSQGTRSALQITLNRHQAIAPTTVGAGWNHQINGVDVQWAPSVDQDILYYKLYHQYGTNSPAAVSGCTQVTGTSCSDLSAPSPNPPATPTCQNPPQSYTTANYYWVVGVDKDPTTGQPRESTALSPKVDANLCDHPPSAPANLSGTLTGGVMKLSWSLPVSPVDPDTGDSIEAWRIYRWNSTGSAQFPGSRLDLVGSLDSTGNPVTTYSDPNADPAGVTQSYCVTAVDTHLNESPCSNVVTG